jgi:putative endonuclease
MFSVYILQTNDTSFYIGQTQSIKERLIRHNQGECGFTKTRLPVRLVHTEEFSTRAQAMKREKQLKSLKSRKALIQLIETEK